jgi:hypothetical protein
MSCCGSARNRPTNFPSPGRMRATVLFEPICYGEDSQAVTACSPPTEF